MEKSTTGTEVLSYKKVIGIIGTWAHSDFYPWVPEAHSSG